MREMGGIDQAKQGKGKQIEGRNRPIPESRAQSPRRRSPRKEAQVAFTASLKDIRSNEGSGAFDEKPDTMKRPSQPDQEGYASSERSVTEPGSPRDDQSKSEDANEELQVEEIKVISRPNDLDLVIWDCPRCTNTVRSGNNRCNVCDFERQPIRVVLNEGAVVEERPMLHGRTGSDL